jgi:hypothetical protein
MNYRGRSIFENKAAVITGRWMAVRWGVRIGHNTKAGVLAMIDQKVKDERARLAK